MKNFVCLLFVVSTFTAFASDVQVNSLYMQRGVMLSELEHDLNRDLLGLDPVTCAFPLTQAKRIEILKANIATLERDGKLTHCSKRKFVGRKNILENLKAQKKVIENVEKDFTPTSVITPIDPIEKTLPLTTTEVSFPALPAIPDANENIIEPPKPVATASTDNSPVNPEGKILYKELLAGYEGVPFRARGIHGADYFLSDGSYDETFGYAMSASEADGSQHVVYSSNDLPPGINLLNRAGFGSIWGIPKKAGSFNPYFRVTLNSLGDASTVTKKLYQGNVPIRILPRPRSTVLNSFLGNGRTQNLRFLNRGAPLLSVKLPDHSSNTIDAVSSINGLKSGKLYYEVTVDEFFPEKDGLIPKSDLTVGVRTEEGVFKDALTGFPTEYGLKVAMKAPNRETEEPGDWLPLVKNGDVINVAFDTESKSLWVGVNGKWLPSRGGTNIDPDPAKGLGATNVATGSSSEFFNRQGSVYLAEVGGQRTSVTFNFGDQPWRNPPPQGFQSIPYRIEDLEKFYLPVGWNTNSGSEFAIAQESMANENLRLNPVLMSFISPKMYLDGAGGETMLAEAPKSSGKWQFEISSKNSAPKVRMGLAPANFTPGAKLGGAGNGSLGITHLEKYGSNKGVFEIDGKQIRFDTPAGPHDEVRFTFVCDFDSKKVDIFANGKFLFSHALPANPSGSWAIAGSTSSQAWVHLHTLKKGSILQVNNHKNISESNNTFGEMRYPVDGVPVWKP